MNQPRRTREAELSLILLGLLLMVLGGWAAPDWLRLNISRTALTSLPPDVSAALADLEEPVTVTYYTLPRRRLPASMKNLPDDVRGILREMERKSGNKLTFEMVDPTRDHATGRGLARWRIGPFNVKSVTRDEYAVHLVWSGMMVAYKEEQRSIPYVVSEHLPHLAERIVHILRQIDEKRPAVIAFSSDQPHELFQNQSAEHATLRRFQFETESIPEEADLLFLTQPKLNSVKIDEIHRFLNDGKNVFMFVSPVAFDLERGPGGEARANLRTFDTGVEPLLKEWGVELATELLIDPSVPHDPLGLRIRSSFIDFSDLRLKRTGTLLAPMASPVVIHPAQAARAGARVRVFMHSSPQTRPMAATGGSVPLGHFLAQADSPEKMSRANIGVVIQDENPWSGRLFLFSTRLLFEDEIMERSNPNRLFLRNLLLTFTADNELLAIKSSRREMEKMPPLSSAERHFWRVVTVFFIPGLVLMIPLIRGGRKGMAAVAAAGRDKMTVAVNAGVPFACLVAVAVMALLPPVRWDVTEDRVNTLSPEVKSLIKNISGPVKITYAHSPLDEWPADGKTLVGRVKFLLANIERMAAGAVEVAFEAVPADRAERPETAARLARLEIEPFPHKTVREDTYTERTVLSGIAIENSGRRETINPVAPDQINQLEFLLVSALKRSDGERKKSVAVLTDHHTVTPAEAYMEYSQHQLAVPEAADQYSSLKNLLNTYGYSVINFLPRTTDPIDADVILYIQPFVISEHVKSEINRHLISGKNMILAVQHFDMQQRRYGGRKDDSGVVYWPNPKFPRVNELLEPYGIELTRQVLFDKTRSDARLPVQMRWGVNVKIMVEQSVALPFLIRAVPENFNKNSPITSQLSQQLFISPNRFHRLEAFPETLRWTNLITTSERAWEYDWSGGFLTPDQMNTDAYAPEKLPLAVLVEGRFPRLTTKRPVEKESRLVLIGGSTLFQNANLLHADYRPQDLMMNALVDLTYGGDLARLHSRGTSIRRGIAYVDARAKLLWRSAVVFLPVACFVLFGLVRKGALFYARPLFRPTTN